jgi:hypothetical protein
MYGRNFPTNLLERFRKHQIQVALLRFMPAHIEIWVVVVDSVDYGFGHKEKGSMAPWVAILP